MEQTRTHRRSLFGPLLLIGLGILFLFNNLGWWELDFGDLIARFWPLILVAAGLDMLFGRRGGIGGLLAILLIGAIVVGALNFGSTESVAWDQANTQTIAQPLEGAEKAVIKIEAGINRLQVSGYPETEQLVEGRLISHRNEEITTDFSKAGDTAYYTIHSQGKGWFWPRFDDKAAGLWELRLHQETPISLHVSTGVGNAKLDLDRLHLTELEVNSGVGQAMITLPAQGNFAANIDGGIGQLLVLIPDSLPVRIRADAGIGSVQVEGDYQRNGEIYISPAYEGADERVDLSIKGGIGAVTVRQIKEG